MPANRYVLAALIALLPMHTTHGQDEKPQDKPGVVTIGEQGSDQDPLSGRDRGLAVEAERGDKVHQVEGILGVPAMSVKIDPRVLGVAPGDPLPPLRREGEAVRKRDGRLLPTGDRGYAVFILDADPEAGDEQPLAMVVAPCLTLESMERLLEDRGENLRFTLTGQVHTYRGVNYLLPTSQPKPWMVAEETDEQPQPDETTTDTTNDEPAGEEPKPDPTDPSATEDKPEKDNKDGATPSADEVLDQLLRERNDAPAVIEPEPAPSDDAGPELDQPAGKQVLSDPLLLGLDPEQAQAELKQEGEFLIARTGRLIRSSDGALALFVLDADQKGAPEPPMIMQACKLLETMERTISEQGDDVPFVVTGQVFVYRGANYLLPTIVKREFDRGNLE